MVIRRTRKLALMSLLALFLATAASAQKIKVIVDQDARGPGTSDQQALLVFLQSEKFDGRSRSQLGQDNLLELHRQGRGSTLLAPRQCPV